jgi:hypothetical protein
VSEGNTDRCQLYLALTLEVGQVALLVEGCLGQAERVDDVDLGLDIVVGTLLGLLSGSVGTGVCAKLAPLPRTTVFCGAAYRRSHHRR